MREVDLPDQVGGAETGDGERRGEPEVPVPQQLLRRLGHRPCRSVRTRPRRPPESRVERERVHVDRRAAAGELGLAVADVGTQLDHARPSSPSRSRVEVSPCSTPSASAARGREPRRRAAAEQRREGAVARPGGDRHLGAAGASSASRRPSRSSGPTTAAKPGSASPCRTAQRVCGTRASASRCALAQARADEHAGLGRDRVREPEARRPGARDRGRRARADDAVDAAARGEPLERDLVVGLEDRAAVGQPEPRSAGVAVDRDHVAAARAGRREQRRSAARRARAASRAPPVRWPRDVDPRRAGRGAASRPRARRELDGAPGGRGPGRDGDGAGGLGRGAARRASSSPGASSRTAGRASARSPARSGGCWPRPPRHVQLEVADLQQLVRRGGESLVNGRERAGASIAIQLRERLEDAVVLTHSASATVREALLHTPPAASSARSPRRRTRAARSRRSCARTGSRSSWSRTTRRPPARVGLAAAARRRHGLPRRHALQQDGHARPGRGGGGRRACRSSSPAR